MNCQIHFVRQEGERFIHRCEECGREVRSKYRDPAMRKQTCGIAGPPPLEATLPPKDRAAFEQAAKSEGMLLGDYIAAMTSAIGIPPCGGCEKRKQWLNAAHRWVKERLAVQRAETPAAMPLDARELTSR